MFKKFRFNLPKLQKKRQNKLKANTSEEITIANEQSTYTRDFLFNHDSCELMKYQRHNNILLTSSSTHIKVWNVSSREWIRIINIETHVTFEKQLGFVEDLFWQSEKLFLSIAYGISKPQTTSLHSVPSSLDMQQQISNATKSFLIFSSGSPNGKILLSSLSHCLVDLDQDRLFWCSKRGCSIEMSTEFSSTIPLRKTFSLDSSSLQMMKVDSETNMLGWIGLKNEKGRKKIFFFALVYIFYFLS